MSDYAPIACADHERLEFAVLTRGKLRLGLRDDQGPQRVLVVAPTDVATRDGAEWLSYRDESGETGVIRLDRIVSIAPA